MKGNRRIAIDKKYNAFIGDHICITSDSLASCVCKLILKNSPEIVILEESFVQKRFVNKNTFVCEFTIPNHKLAAIKKEANKSPGRVLYIEISRKQIGGENERVAVSDPFWVKVRTRTQTAKDHERRDKIIEEKRKRENSAEMDRSKVAKTTHPEQCSTQQ